MPAWKGILLRTLYPGRILASLIPAGGFSLLAAVFYKGWENTPLAYISYVFAFYSLVLLILNGIPTMSILRVIRQKGKHDPLNGAISNINLTAALMSLYALQVAMLNIFGDTQQLRFLFNTISGTAVCLMAILGAIGMVVYGCVQKKQLGKPM